MAKSVRSRRTAIAAGALSIALVAPFVSPVTDAPTAQAVEASAFDTRYTTDNFWNANEAVVQGLELEPGDKVESTRGTGFQVRTAGCAVVVARPWSALGFRTGNQDIAVKVTKADGSTFNTTLRVDVVDEDVADNTFTEPDQCPTPEPTTTPETAPTSEDAPAEEPTTTSATEPTSTSNGPQTTASTFNDRFPTANFWNQQEAVIEGLTLQPGDVVAPTTNTIFNWKFRNDDGVLTLIRPQSPTGFKSGNVDIPVRVTPANGEVFTTTLRVNVIDERPGAEWESQLASRYPVDFEKSTSAQPVEGITLPAGVTVSKTGAALPTGWSVSNDGTTIRVTPPTTFKEGDFDLPIEVNDGTDKFKATLKIAAKNPSKTPAETAGTVAGILGPILGSLIGAGTGSGLLGNIIGGLTGGGSDGGEGGTGGGGGRLINVVITNNANPSNIGNNNGSPNVIITDNVNPNVVITDNVNPRDNLSNNGNPSVVITNNANPTVEIKDNLSNNGNPVITNNANPSVVITGNVNDNLRDNGSNNSVVVTGNANPVVTGNANPVVTGNANDNGSNNSAVVTGNANPTVVITGNANDNGSNNSAVVTGNANPVITDNANNNGSNNSVVATGNANPEVLVTGNANGGLFGSSRRGGQNGEPAQGDEGQAENGRSSILDANVGVEGGSSDPRCIASLVALGLPLIAMIPLSMAGQIGVPGLGNTAVQAEKAFADAARRFNLEPAQLAAVGGGALGLVAAVVLAAAVRNCVPSVRSIDLAVGGSSNKPAETVAAPVVDTQN
ncbi:hypothetical protein [Corynebacterium sp. HMSC034A01]|uniref:hypothetical protein n=1 Tax=Corynebacterium sp. HMSC034A01 TaxID=1739295 RepID=UPI0008AA1850|nr:hypothetical protein [Corynebacterium sp. HMSC034A01]OHR19000.1 hypothetical protein HMPREF2791_03115 [Corynebacterium sp. HMSC034A01]